MLVVGALTKLVSVSSSSLDITYESAIFFARWGTRATRFVGTLLINIGCLMISETSSQESWILYPAFIFYNVGGFAISFLSNSQLGNLYGRWKASIITLMIGCTQGGSSLTPTIMKLIFETGVSTTTIFRVINILSVFVWCRTFLFLPKKHIPFPLPKNGYRCGLQRAIESCSLGKAEKQKGKTALGESSSSSCNDSVGSSQDLQPKPLQDRNEAGAKFIHHLKKPLFWSEAIFMVVLHVRAVFFTSTFTTWIDNTYQLTDDDLTNIITVFALIQSGVVLTAPINGLFIDLLVKKNTKAGYGQREAKILGLFSSKLMACVCSIVVSTFICINSFPLQYATIVVFLILRSFMYGGSLALLALLYPKEHYGKLVGSVQSIFGLLQLLQFPLFDLVLHTFNGDFLPLNIAFVVACTLIVS